MAAIIKRVPWTVQPQYPVGLDHSHQSYRAGTYAWLGTSGLLTDVQRAQPSPTYLNRRAARNTLVGRGQEFKTLTEYAGPYTLPDMPKITFLMAIVLDSAAGFPLLFSRGGLNGPVVGFNQGAGTNDWSFLYPWTTGGFWYVNNFGTTFTGFLGISYDGTAAAATKPTMWKNGVKQTVSVNTNSATTRSDTSGTTFAIGCDSSDLSNQFNGVVPLFVIIPDALSDPEMARLTFNPWQIFDPQTRSIFFDAATGAPPPAGAQGLFWAPHLDGISGGSIFPGQRVQ